MKKQPKILACLLGFLMLGVYLLAATSHGQQSAANAAAAGAGARKYLPTPARLARGRYLTEVVTGCFYCHSQVDWTSRPARILPGRKGGGAPFPVTNLPFKLMVPNISPDRETGTGAWSDDELARAIREGIGRDGRRLIPVMPYRFFRALSDEDLASIIVYLRSVPPVRNRVTPTLLEEPFRALLPPLQPPLGSVPPPDLSTPAKRGAYLTTIGLCGDCHHPVDPQLQPLNGLEFGGGFILEGPWGRVASANITPDASGISYYDGKLFIETIRTGSVRTRPLSTIMPWSHYRNLTDEDLKALFAYLRSLKPVVHRVDNTEPPTPCKVCGQSHGYGDRN